MAPLAMEQVGEAGELVRVGQHRAPARVQIGAVDLTTAAAPPAPPRRQSAQVYWFSSHLIAARQWPAEAAPADACDLQPDAHRCDVRPRLRAVVGLARGTTAALFGWRKRWDWLRRRKRGRWSCGGALPSLSRCATMMAAPPPEHFIGAAAAPFHDFSTSHLTAGVQSMIHFCTAKNLRGLLVYAQL